MDRPNSQTTRELYHACVASFFGFNMNTTAFCLGRYSLHLLLLKSSMANLINHTAAAGSLKYQSKVPTRLIFYHAQCAQIWRNFRTSAKFWKHFGYN